PCTVTRIVRRAIGLLAMFGLAVSGSARSLEQVELTGTICDGNAPIAGASVSIPGTTLFTTADSSGRFTLALPASSRATHLVASAPGYYIGGTIAIPSNGDVVISLRPHASEDNPRYEWLSALAASGNEKACETCHYDARDPSLRLFEEWRADAHSRSATNPRFLSMYRGTDLAGRSTASTRFVSRPDYGRFPIGPDPRGVDYGPGFELDFPHIAGNCAACHAPADAIRAPYATRPHELTPVGREGVTCDVCHKIVAVRTNAATGAPYENTPGVTSFEFRRPPDGAQFFAGPYDDVDVGVDVHSPLHRESLFCAPCHQGSFWSARIYDSFGEWQKSQYADRSFEAAASCQGCHMPRGASDHVARFEEGARLRDPAEVATHRMLGAGDAEFVASAATLSIDAQRDGEVIEVKVDVRNARAGHHLPTDSPLRHIILAVRTRDARGRDLALSSGPVLPAWTGAFARQPGRVFAKVLRDLWADQEPTGAYWRPVRLVADTRIPALGSDISHYRFTAPDGAAAFIDVQLIYRRAFEDLARAKGWQDSDIVMQARRIRVP
ncbi:MAG TPA: hypothetical protein VIL97_04765, partial [Thermoanaerobaculia bacterium]